MKSSASVFTLNILSVDHPGLTDTYLLNTCCSATTKKMMEVSSK